MELYLLGLVKMWNLGDTLNIFVHKLLFVYSQYVQMYS